MRTTPSHQAHSFLLGGLLLLIAAMNAAAEGAGSSDSQRAEPAFSALPYIKAAHWFGQAWPVNFWNTDLESIARDQFGLLREDGFNTVVFLVPWPGFAPDPTSGDLDPDRVRRLRGLMLLAHEAGLDSIIRISYAWDWLDRSSGDRLRKLWTHETYYQGWLGHIEALWDEVRDIPGFKFGFFSWEDLWGITWYESADLVQRQQAAIDSGFVNWLDRELGEEVVKENFGLDAGSEMTIAIPQRREPAYRFFMQFVSEMWLQRFFTPARQRFPRLSMEIRLDSDPIFEGDQIVDWFDHSPAWNLPGAEWLTAYWSPAMGGQNQGEQLSPEEAAQRLQRSLNRMADAVDAKQIFIGQFLFEDFTPGYELNGRIPRDQVPRFLELATEVLRGHSGGVGLWTWADYGHDGIANPEFHAGLAGWETNVSSSLAGDQVLLGPNDWIATELMRFAYSLSGQPDLAELCVRARAPGGQARLLVFQGEEDEPFAELTFVNEFARSCVDHDLAVRWLRFEAEGNLIIDRVNSIGFVQQSGIRDRNFELKSTGPAYRALNSGLDYQPRLKRERYEDGWMGGRLVTQLHAESAVDSLRLQTFLPEGWPIQPRLSVTIDGDHVGDVECGGGSESTFTLPRPLTAGQAVLVSISASAVHQPSGEDRELGCYLLDLSLPDKAQ